MNAQRESSKYAAWHVLAAMLAFFGASSPSMSAFAAIAVRSFPGEDVRRSYLQGLHTTDTLAERRTQAALGWRASAHLPAPKDAACWRSTLRDARRPSARRA